MPLRTDHAETNSAGRSGPLAEAHLVVLYMLSRLGSATDANLLDFLTEAQVMNYMELMPALGLLRAESVDDARVFFEDEGPLQLFIDRLAEMRRRYAEQKAREFAWRLHPIRSFFWWLRRHFP